MNWENQRTALLIKLFNLFSERSVSLKGFRSSINNQSPNTLLNSNLSNNSYIPLRNHNASNMQSLKDLDLHSTAQNSTASKNQSLRRLIEEVKLSSTDLSENIKRRENIKSQMPSKQ